MYILPLSFPPSSLSLCLSLPISLSPSLPLLSLSLPLSPLPLPPSLPLFLPLYQRTPFSTPARSLLKTITMTTGEFEFDSIFRQSPEVNRGEGIPYPPISYILWIAFIILMPILLTNLLVSII